MPRSPAYKPGPPFLFASYLFGHLVSLLGSRLNELYEWARRYTLNTQITQITLLAHRGRFLRWLGSP